MMRRFIYIAAVLFTATAVSVATADDPDQDGAYLDDLEALQRQIEVAQEGSQPRHPSSKERALEGQLAEMQDRAVRAEAALETCQAEVTALKAAP
jgi:hypothetical protein